MATGAVFTPAEDQQGDEQQDQDDQGHRGDLHPARHAGEVVVLGHISRFGSE